MIPQFVFLALGTLASEDLTCITAGVLIAQGKLGFIEGVLACLTGIICGDILLFMVGRLIGRPALGHSLVARFVSREKVETASQWLSERGLSAVLISRFTPGLRLATYFAAGSLRTQFWSFAGYFVVASALWTPLLVGSTVLFGDQLLRAVFAHNSRNPLAFATASGVIAANLLFSRQLLSYAGRRRIAGFLKRIVCWEFWPPWVAYLPVLPYLALLALRYRSLTMFTAANPAIPSGGFVGESKSAILKQLSRVTSAVADFEVIPHELDPCARIHIARKLMDRRNLSFPVVLKPDVGERGSGVAVIRSDAEMQSYLRQAQDTVILQRYIDGLEFGVFYYRHPAESLGRIFSITDKRFPRVTGDGSSTLAELILQDPRAVCMAAAYAAASKRPLDNIPAAGEAVSLIELGSHCRGAIFLDGSRWNTPALERAIDEIGRAYPGFYFGRFDIRTPSIGALQHGIFSILELNGVAAEATHIYDPAVNIIEAYRVMFQQWRVAFAIGAANTERGAQPSTVAELLSLLLRKFRARPIASSQPRPVQAVEHPAAS